MMTTGYTEFKDMQPHEDVNENVDASDRVVNSYIDDRNEIICIAESLSRDRKYGAAQLIYRLARERDEARAALDDGRASATP